MFFQYHDSHPELRLPIHFYDKDAFYCERDGFVEGWARKRKRHPSQTCGSPFKRTATGEIDSEKYDTEASSVQDSGSELLNKNAMFD